MLFSGQDNTPTVRKFELKPRQLFPNREIELFTNRICEQLVMQVRFPCDIRRYVNSGAAQKMAVWHSVSEVACEIVHYGLLQGKMVFSFFISAIQMDRRVRIPGHICVLIIYGERKKTENDKEVLKPIQTSN